MSAQMDMPFTVGINTAKALGKLDSERLERYYRAISSLIKDLPDHPESSDVKAGVSVLLGIREGIHLVGNFSGNG